jgi:hypothetical protein
VSGPLPIANSAEAITVIVVASGMCSSWQPTCGNDAASPERMELLSA